MYKGERVLEFITFYQNALHLTTLILPECIAFNHAECTAVPFTKMHRATTLGARDFSSAVSGFSQVFIVTRAKSGFGLRPTPQIPTAREKNLWYPGYRATYNSNKNTMKACIVRCPDSEFSLRQIFYSTVRGLNKLKTRSCLSDQYDG